MAEPWYRYERPWLIYRRGRVVVGAETPAGDFAAREADFCSILVSRSWMVVRSSTLASEMFSKGEAGFLDPGSAPEIRREPEGKDAAGTAER